MADLASVRKQQHAAYLARKQAVDGADVPFPVSVPVPVPEPEPEPEPAKTEAEEPAPPVTIVLDGDSSDDSSDDFSDERLGNAGTVTAGGRAKGGQQLTSDAAFAAELQKQLDSENRPNANTLSSDAALAASLRQQDAAPQKGACASSSAASNNSSTDADAAFAASLQSEENSDMHAHSNMSSLHAAHTMDSDAALAASLQDNEHARAGGRSPNSAVRLQRDRGKLVMAQTAEAHARTPGLPQLLHNYYTSQRKHTDRDALVWLAQGLQGAHYHQVLNPRSRGRRFGDPPRSDGYSCGWRSMQMVCSALMETSSTAKQKLFGGSGFVPSLEDMKQWLEVAWQEGWDPDGWAQMSTVVGRPKWVGTTECWALLSSFGISARIISFKSARGSGGGVWTGSGGGGGGRSKKRPHAGNGGTNGNNPVASAVEQWLWQYFGVESSQGKTQKKSLWDRAANKGPRSSEPSKGVYTTDKFPLYMQHDGHSRVVVGVAVRGMRGGGDKGVATQLLILDPNTYGPDLKASLSNHTNVRAGYRHATCVILLCENCK